MYLKEERDVLLSCKAFGLVHTCDAKMQNATQMQALGLEFFFLAWMHWLGFGRQEIFSVVECCVSDKSFNSSKIASEMCS